MREESGMENFELYNPVKIIFGPGEVSKTGEEAAKLGKKAMVVSYREHDFFADLLKSIETMLTSAGLGVVPYYEVTANPLMGQVDAAVRLCKAEDVDLIIAVGGGSAMDVAKITAAGVRYQGDLWEMIVSRHDQEVAEPPEKALPLLMVPTLPATSSEMNCGAVVTNEKIMEKSYVFAECLYPKVSIVDPSLTCSLPPFQTACGAADTISHAMETYLNGVDDTPLQDRLLEGVIITIMENVGKALEDPGNVKVRAHLQWASVIAWNGWFQAGIGGWAPMHQLGHVLSARHNVTHGASLAVVMVAWMKYLHEYRLERYVQFADRILGMDVNGKEPDAVAQAAIDQFDSFLKGIGVPTRLSDCKISENEIDPMVDDVVRISFGPDGKLNSRPPIDRKQVKAIYNLAI
jgi:alcohol dehydrogenase YqhD (iron-dependent ADH family)